LVYRGGNQDCGNADRQVDRPCVCRSDAQEQQPAPERHAHPAENVPLCGYGCADACKPDEQAGATERELDAQTPPAAEGSHFVERAGKLSRASRDATVRPRRAQRADRSIGEFASFDPKFSSSKYNETLWLAVWRIAAGG
jgi:hypothetical protein